MPLLQFSSSFIVNKVAGKNIHVLITDDNQGWCEILSQAITEIARGLTVNITVNIANNGARLMTALAKKTEPLPDIIIMDINMPGKNGFECLEEIRRDERLKDIPVIMHSSSLNPADIDFACKKGANLFLPKPDSFTELKLMLGAVLETDWKKTGRVSRKDFVVQPKTSE